MFKLKGMLMLVIVTGMRMLDTTEFVESQNVFSLAFESTSFLDLMNGKKTRDYYYMQLQGLSGFGNLPDAHFDAVNKCIKTAKVYRMLEDINSDIDMTRCTGEFHDGTPISIKIIGPS